jgi:hypothetical protein
MADGGDTECALKAAITGNRDLLETVIPSDGDPEV